MMLLLLTIALAAGRTWTEGMPLHAMSLCQSGPGVYQANDACRSFFDFDGDGDVDQDDFGQFQRGLRMRPDPLPPVACSTSVEICDGVLTQTEPVCPP